VTRPAPDESLDQHIAEANTIRGLRDRLKLATDGIPVTPRAKERQHGTTGAATSGRRRGRRGGMMADLYDYHAPGFIPDEFNSLRVTGAARSLRGGGRQLAPLGPGRENREVG
jgi:hypothetical protein